MQKKLLCGMVMGVFFLCLTGAASATLTTIGTATYSGSDYKLIWDDDNNGNSVVWLDYTNGGDETWAGQNAWAAGLDPLLTINLNLGYSVVWNDSAWRLPSTVDGLAVYGYDGTTTTGYNITSSEMGHLFYAELGNLGLVATDGSWPQPGWGLANTGDFENLLPKWYWSGTAYSADPAAEDWLFAMNWGGQGGGGYGSFGIEHCGLALRSGQVSTVAPTPIPAPVLLLGTGLLGLTPFARRKKGSRC